MADTDPYPEFKKEEEQGTVILVPRRRFRVTRRIVRADKTEDYAAYKAIAAATAEDIKREMRTQHDLTRAAVQNSTVDVLAAIKSSPTGYLKLMCEFGSLFLLFCLAVRFTLNIELVNTVFGVFMLIAFAVYWAMASLKQRSERRKPENPQPA